MDGVENLLTRTALGRVGFLGELYDCRSETFSSSSIFRKGRLPSFIRKTDIGRMEIDYKFTENLSERYNLLNIEGELQVCLLSGMINAEGSGKFLRDEKKTFNSISCSLICKIETVSEKIVGFLKEYVQYLDLSTLTSNQYTHLVTEIIWGANCILHLEATFESESEKSQVQSNLQGEIDKIASLLKVKGRCDVDHENIFNKLFKDIKISISADVVPEEELPITVNSFCNLVSKLPDLLKKTQYGRGKPLKYRMMPLSAFREMAKLETGLEIVVLNIDETFLISMVCCFEDISLLKLKISDLMELLKIHEKYVSKETLSEARQQCESLKQKESMLKDLLSQNWVEVKSGTKSFRDFVREVEKFKSQKLQLHQYEEYLDSCSEVIDMISGIKLYISAGVTYFGSGESPTQEFIKNFKSSYIVLVKSKKFEKENLELHYDTCLYFMSLVHEKSENTKYVVVDLDYLEDKNSTIFGNVAMTTCLRMREGKVIHPDLYKDYLSQLNSNFIKIKDGEEFENHLHKPGNRVLLEMVCPGRISNTCSWKKQLWTCFFCKVVVEYDIAGYFYCNCGKAGVTSFEYRCSDSNHGSNFMPIPKKFLYNELCELKPLPEVNILILGQTGVGKSTWINSIVNYMKYDSMNDGRQGGVICTIPIRFTHYDSEGKEYDIRLGDPDDGEVLETGQSATQYCRTYCFYWRNKYFRIIDTPGIGDVRGIEKDKENMRHIIDYIGHLQELHGVCVLLRANESKIGPVFSYCLHELLVHLHKDVAKNIVFCFTNARNSFYSPGQTSVLVRKLLTDLEIEDQLNLGQHNSFCLDNEAFLFLCMLQYPDIRFSEHLIKDFEQSWNISVKETHRLFETIVKFEPHILSQTVSLCRARNRILLLSKPLAEICRTIQMNVNAMEMHKKEVERTAETISELEQSLYYEEIHLEPITLSQPRTVCTSASCVEYVQIKSLGITEVEYKTHCHVNCSVIWVTPKTINNILLYSCSAMSWGGTCKVCGCGWQSHMHLLIDQRRVVKQVKSKIIEEDINKNLSEKEKKEKIIRDFEDKIKEYEKEQDIITRTSVKMGIFLKRNAISVYNDAISGYLNYMIDEAENNPHKTKWDKGLLKQLKETLRRYEKEMEVLQEAVEAPENPINVPTPEDIYKLEQELYSLKLTGKDIENYVKTQTAANSSQIKYSEVQLGIPKGKASRKIENHRANKIEDQSSGSPGGVRNFISQKLSSLKSFFQ